jgi:alpha-beta hydrolase superfamily lysophospholipase
MAIYDGYGATTPSSEFRFTSKDGLSIVCFRWDGSGLVRGVVQIAHGLGEHIGRYVGLIEVLIKNGFSVYGNDHRGHGRTALAAGNFGDFGTGGFNLLVEDMVQLSRVARVENPDKPLILLGHSMGSFAAQQFVLDHSEEIDGLVFSGSGALDGLVRVANSAHPEPNQNLLNAAFEPARTPFDWLSRDRAVVDAFISDPLCFPALQPAAQESFFAAANKLSNSVSLREIRHDLPIYVFSGSNDPVGQQLEGVHLLMERYHKAGISDISHDFYNGGRHEMLNEINRGEVRANLLHWITKVLENKRTHQ